MDLEALKPAGRDDVAGTVLRGVVRAMLVAAILLFIPGLYQPFIVPKAAALRVLGIPLLLFVAFEAALRGRTGLRGHPAKPGPPPRPQVLDAIVALWALASALSTWLGVSPRLSWLGEIEQREGLATVLALTGLYFGARRSHADPGHVRGTLTTVIVAATLAALYAMLQRIGVDPIEWEAAATYPTAGGPLLRPFGTLGNALLLGAVLAPALSAGLARALAPRPRDSWLIPALAMIGATIAMTLSRGALLAAGVGVAVAALSALVWGRIGRMAGVMALVLGPAALWAFLALRAPWLARLAESADPRAESLPARLSLARSAGMLWNERPWLGFGPDSFGLVFPSAQLPAFWRNGWIGLPVHAHTVPLQLLVTGGLIGTVIVLAWFVATLSRLSTRWSPPEYSRSVERVSILAALVSLAVAAAFNVVGLAGIALFVILSASAATMEPKPVTAGGSTEASAGDRAPRAAGSGAPIALVAALALAAILIWEAVPEFRGLGAAHAARAALIESTRSPAPGKFMLLGEALRRARTATAIAPAEDELWRLHCDAALAYVEAVESGGGDRRRGPVIDSLAAEAERAARRALALEPRRATNHGRLANALAARGRPELAEAAFDEAVRLAPVDALLLVDRVRVELSAGTLDRALRSARSITTLYPQEAIGHSIEAGIWIAKDRPAEARRALERALKARWEAGSEPQRAAAERALRALELRAAPQDSGVGEGGPLPSQKGLLHSPEKR